MIQNGLILSREEAERILKYFRKRTLESLGRESTRNYYVTLQEEGVLDIYSGIESYLNEQDRIEEVLATVEAGFPE